MSLGLSERINNCYFYFMNYAFPIYGKKGAALYDLLTGDVYKVRKDLLETLDRRNTVRDKIAAWEKKGKRHADIIKALRELERLKIGYLDEKVIFIDKIRIPFTEEDLEGIEETRLGTLSMRILGSCNLNCVDCDIKRRLNCICYKDGRGIVEFSALKQVFDEADSLKFNTISLYGGEPFLHKDISAILKYLSNLSFKAINVFTNGTLIDGKIANDLSGMDKVSLSIIVFGADKRIHDRIAGKKNSWKQTFNNIDRIQRKGMKLTLHLLIMKENENILGEAKRAFAEKNYEYVVDFIKPRRVIENSPSMGINRFERNVAITEPKFGKISIYDFFRNQEWNSCWGFNVSIDVGGEIRPCLWSDEIVGNLMKDRIRDVLVTKRLSKYWKLSKNKVRQCNSCEYRLLCPDCRVAAKCYSGSILSKYPYCKYNPNTSTWDEA